MTVRTAHAGGAGFANRWPCMEHFEVGATTKGVIVPGLEIGIGLNQERVIPRVIAHFLTGDVSTLSRHIAGNPELVRVMTNSTDGARGGASRCEGARVAKCWLS